MEGVASTILFFYMVAKWLLDFLLDQVAGGGWGLWYIDINLMGRELVKMSSFHVVRPRWGIYYLLLSFPIAY